MKDQPPLRLSEWSGAAAPPRSGSDAPPPPIITPPAAPPTPSTPASTLSPPAAAADPAPTKPQPAPVYTPPPVIFQGFDLLRIPTGILRRWWIPVAAGVAGALLGILLGAVLWPPESTVSVRLMSRNPKNFSAGSEAYTPGTLQGATLLGALKSPQVAREVASKFGDGARADELLDMVSVEEVRKTDFVDIIFATPYDAERTAQLARLWGEEALNFTSRLQSDETRETKSYLEEQLRAMQADIESVNTKLTELRRNAGVVDADKEIDAALRSLADIKLRFQTVRTSHEAVEHKLSSLRAEIRKHGPGMDQLRSEEKHLAELAEYYTDINPVFQEARDRVDRLRETLNAETSSPDTPTSQFVGSQVANSIYLQILEAESEQESLALQEEELGRLEKEAREKLNELPKLQMEAAPLLERATSLRISQDALLKRLKEVSVFHDVSPGYFRLFKVPSAKDVQTSSRVKRMVIGGFLMGFFSFGLGLVACAGLEFLDATVRTSAEASAIFEAPCLANVAANHPASRAPDLWASVVGPLSSGAVRSFWAPVPSPAGADFWASMLEAAQRMALPIVIVHLEGPIPAPLENLPRISPAMLRQHRGDAPAVLVELPPAIDAARARETIATLKAAAAHLPAILVEAVGFLQIPVSNILREFPQPVVLCALNAADRTFWKTQRSLLGSDFPVKGVVALG